MEIMVSYMEANSDLAKGICVKTQAKKRWELLTTELNSHGPPVRNWEKWVKVWTDFKFKTRKKKAQNKLEMRSTGGGPNKLHSFSQLEESVISLLEMDIYMDPPGREFGLGGQGLPEPDPTVNEFCEEKETPIHELLETDICMETPPARKQIFNQTKVKEDRLDLLRAQTENQGRFYKSLLDTMQQINERCKNTEDYTRKRYYMCKDFQRDCLAIKKERLKILKNELECSQRDRRLKLNLKQQILELQKDQINSNM